MDMFLPEKLLNFPVSPNNIPATEIVSKVESTIRTLESETADNNKSRDQHPLTG